MSTPERYRRRRLRLDQYDYSQPGAYFVTVCAHDRMCLFGKIEQAEMRLSAIGEIVAACWQEVPQHFAVLLDEWVVMPNHLHAIVLMRDDIHDLRPTASLGLIIGTFKSAATKRVKEALRQGSPLWQRSFYEHVVRNDADLRRIRQYITDNPLRWAEDSENPDVIARS
jgi:putative transposase